MQIYPAIDIKRGQVVRVMERDGAETVYAPDPVAQARAFLAAGATWLHVVDLDRAYRTGGDNRDAISRIVATAAVAGASVQVGGLLTETADVAAMVAAGATRAVIAPAVATQPGRLAELVRAVGVNRLALALDVRGGRLVLRGAAGATGAAVPDIDVVVDTALEQGVRDIVYRDLDRDGVLAGFDLDGAGAVRARGGRVIVAGGGASLDDLRGARAAGLSGVIVGRALYEKRFSLEEAIACSG